MAPPEEHAPDTERMKNPPLPPNIAFHHFSRVLWNCIESRRLGRPLPSFDDDDTRLAIEQAIASYDAWRDALK